MFSLTKIMENSIDSDGPVVNAWLIRTVVEIFLAKLDNNAIKRCRNVCSLWGTIGLEILVKRGYVSLNKSMNDENSYNLLDALINYAFPSPRNIILKLDRNMTVLLSVYNSCPGKAEKFNNSKCTSSFLTTVHDEILVPLGGNIRSVIFEDLMDIKEVETRDVFINIICALTRIEMIKLRCLPKYLKNVETYEGGFVLPYLWFLKRLDISGNNGVFEFFFRRFLDVSPNLISLRVHMNDRRIPEFLAWSSNVETLRGLQELELTGASLIDQIHLDAITDAKLGLKSVAISGRSLAYDVDFSGLFRQLAPTIVKAHICCRMNFENDYELRVGLYDYWLQMPILRTLEVSNWLFDYSYSWNLEFVRNFPFLQDLTLHSTEGGFFPDNILLDEDGHEYEYQNNGWVSFSRYSVEIILPYTHEFISRLVLPDFHNLRYDFESFGIFLSRLVNLQYLILAADNIAMKCVIQNAPNLQKLELTKCSAIYDMGITGLPSYQMLEIYDKRLKPKGTTDGVHALSHLWSLSINGMSGKITNRSLEFGIAKSQSIKTCTLIGCDIDETGLAILRAMNMTVFNWK